MGNHSQKLLNRQNKLSSYDPILLKSAFKKRILISRHTQQGANPIQILRYQYLLSSIYQYVPNRKIEDNTTEIQQISQQQQTLSSKLLMYEQYPFSCIGIILCQNYQNGKIVSTYGTGILIHNNIVLTSAQNIYCRRLRKQYMNIRFIPGLSGKKHSGIYDAVRIYFPQAYDKVHYDYAQHNFAIIQLYHNLVDNYGYIGWKTNFKAIGSNTQSQYAYKKENKQGSFKLVKVIRKQEQYDSVKIIKQGAKKYYIVGINDLMLTENMMNTINGWTERNLMEINKANVEWRYRDFQKYLNVCHISELNLSRNYINKEIWEALNQINWTHLNTIDLSQCYVNPQICQYLIQIKWNNLTTINLYNNTIDAAGCKKLKKANWPHLTSINLANNNIGKLGLKYLTDANWTNLTSINLVANNIGDDGCKYLTEVSWPNLRSINIGNNEITVNGCKYFKKTKWTHLININLWNTDLLTEGCKYLNQANWIYLKSINLDSCKIGVQGCKYLITANWNYLTTINLNNNQIYAEGCKYLIRFSSIYLVAIYLGNNKIAIEGCKYLRESNWDNLTAINLWNNNIYDEGCRYLRDANWKHLNTINLGNNNIKNTLLQQVVRKQKWFGLKI